MHSTNLLLNILLDTLRQFCKIIPPDTREPTVPQTNPPRRAKGGIIREP